MTSIYNQILKAKSDNQKLLAILLDPDKIVWENLDSLISKINQSPATHIFIGGSHVENNIIDELIIKLREFFCCGGRRDLPIVLFPGNPSQISKEADAILFLSLLSGRNPDYLIGHQVKAAPILKRIQLEIIPTAYILIESGNETAVARVSETEPLDRTNLELVLATAQAGEMLGNKMIYLEAGSGAQQSVPVEMIDLISKNTEIPIIVGGGIVDLLGIKKAHDSGADIVVIGTAFERDIDFFESAEKCLIKNK
jgi:putative glycerol-1-phosphate prenyltransferase